MYRSAFLPAILLASNVALSLFDIVDALILPSQSHHNVKNLRHKRNYHIWGRYGLVISCFERANRACTFEQLHALSKEQEQICWKLPRLYVGPCHNNHVKPKLTSGACVPLSSEQTHYLLNVSSGIDQVVHRHISLLIKIK